MPNKRKAPSQDGTRPSKIQQTSTLVRVNHLQGSDVAKPAIATTAGAVVPEALNFSSYSKPNAPESAELLLHSSDHATIDYVAVESRTVLSAEKHMNHYVAVFDPAEGKLDVIEAKRMIVRPHIRQYQKEQQSDEEDLVPIAMPSSRAALTEAFGTKKSKKAIQAFAENRLLARGGDSEDALSQAILNGMGAEETEQTEHLDRVQANKPLPKANTGTDKIEEVYPLPELVILQPWTETLSNMSLAYWKGRVPNGKDVTSRSRFVSNRVQYITSAHSKDPNSQLKLQHVQLLRYIEHIINLHQYLASLPRKKRMPDISKWPAEVQKRFDHCPERLVPQCLVHFFPDGTPNQRAMTLLRSTILALSLHVPPPTLNHGNNVLITEPTDIGLDLGMDSKDTAQLFRELGCKIEPATEAELVKWGLTRLAGKIKGDNGKVVSLPKPKFARLQFPLKFPKLSQGQNLSPAKRR